MYTVSQFIKYDHEQGAFMFYGDFPQGFKILPQHFIDTVIANESSIEIICDNKRHRETFSVESFNPDADVEKILWIKEEF